MKEPLIALTGPYEDRYGKEDFLVLLMSLIGGDEQKF